MNRQTSNRLSPLIPWIVIAALVVALVIASANVARSATVPTTVDDSANLGTITVERPSSTVRATVPLTVPRAAWRASERVFGLVDAQGATHPVQGEPVVFTSDGNVAVVELIGTSLPPQPSYTVVELGAPSPDGRPLPQGIARDLAGTLPSIVIDGVSTPLQFAPGSFRSGSSMLTRRIFGPHVFGWISVLDGERFAVLDLVLHDAVPQSPTWTFGTVSLASPGKIVTALPEPTMVGNTLLSCGWMRQRQRREFRLAIAEDADTPRALAYLQGAGFGVSSQWTTADAFGPQLLAVANLDHLSFKLPSGQILTGSAAMSASLDRDWILLRDAVQQGLTCGIAVTYGQPGGRVGDYHPNGSTYGGVTSGSGIDQRRGMDLALTGSNAGRLFYLLEHRTYTDRHPVGLYGVDGSVISPNDHAWFPSDVDGAHWQAHTTDPFAIGPVIATPIDAWAAIDYQHLVRRVSGSIVLAWLDHDPIAEHELRLNAWLWYGAMANKMQSALGTAMATPHHGWYWGRGQGWGAYTVAAYLELTAPQRRVALDGWARTALQCYGLFQMPNGIWQAETNSKFSRKAPFNSQFAVAQSIEHGITANAVFCLGRATGVDVHDQIVLAARQGVWRYAWTGGPNGGSTNAQFAVRPIAYGGTPFDVIPAGMVANGTDSWQIGSTLAYARLLEPNDPDIAAALHAYCAGAADELGWLRTRKWDNLTNREPMLLALQRTGNP